ncbi:MAG: glycine zipper domain-containing protein [Comamonas sp.]
MSHFKVLAASAVLLSCIGLTGCANNQQLGTGVGAVGGAVLGDAVLGGTLGTLGGAAAGAVIGNQIGKNQDNK